MFVVLKEIFCFFLIVNSDPKKKTEGEDNNSQEEKKEKNVDQFVSKGATEKSSKLPHPEKGELLDISLKNHDNVNCVQIVFFY